MIEKELKEMIKESMREVIREERLSLYEILIPYATRKEVNEIEMKFGSPKKYDEEKFVDMTAWIRG